MTQPFAELRQQLTAELGRAPDARIWMDIVHYHASLLEKIERRQARFEDLANLYQTKEETYAPSPRRVQATQREHLIPGDSRLQALAQIAAFEAASEGGGVQHFRKHMLGGSLLAPDQVAPWLRAQAAEQRPQPLISIALASAGPSEWLPEGESRQALGGLIQSMADTDFWITGPLDLLWDREQCASWLEGKAHAIRAGEEDPPPRGRMAERLHFRADESDESVLGFVWVGTAGPLRFLRDIVSEAMNAVPWNHEADAVDFILTGRVPLLPLAHMTVLPYCLPALTRLELTVDPRLGPRTVGILYADGRKAFTTGRDKPMQEKHVQLAVFCAEQLRSKARWQELRGQWNERFPDWLYEESDPMARRFARDARAAFKRVVGRDLAEARKDALEGGDRVYLKSAGRRVWVE